MNDKRPLKVVRPDASSGESDAKKMLESTIKVSEKIKDKGALVLLIMDGGRISYLEGFEIDLNTVIGALERIKAQLIMKANNDE